MGYNAITSLSPRHALYSLILVFLAACSSPSPLPQRITNRQPTQSTIASKVSPSPIPAIGTPTIPVTLTPSQSSLLPEVTPIPSNVPVLSEPISPSNAENLSLIQQHVFSPWDLVHAITWSPDGKRLAVAAGEKVHFFDPNSLQEIITLNPGVWTPDIAFSPKSNLFATGSRDGNISLWDAHTGEKHFSIEAHRKGVNSLTFNPQGQLLASGGNDAVARLWEIETGNNMGQMIGGTYAVPAIAFTPDGNSLAIVNGQVIRLRDVESSRFVITINGEDSFNTIDISPDGNSLAAGDSVNVVTLWDITGSGLTETPILMLEAPNQPKKLVWEVMYSPDGQILASAHNNGDVYLWEVSTGKMLASLIGPTIATTSLAFSPDGNYLATGSLDGTLSLWAVVP